MKSSEVKVNSEVKTYQEAVTYLTEIVRLLNQDFWNNELPECQVTIQSRRGTYAHYTLNEAWQSHDGNGWHELNLAAAYIGSRHIYEVVASAQHELTHHYNFIHGIKDVSGSGSTYHNRNFKLTAEAHGLIIDHDDRYGWTKTYAGPAIMEFCEKYGLNDIQINRNEFIFSPVGGSGAGNGTGIIGPLPPVKKKSSSHKMICRCGNIIRSTKLGLRVKCMDCDTEFIYQN